MYDKDHYKTLRKEFWTGFGQFMSRHISARGPKQKWLNYRTGVRHLFFRFEADREKATIAIDIQHSDPGIRELFYEQFIELKSLLESSTGFAWEWIPEFQQETGKKIARIQISQKGWDIYDTEDWPQIWAWFEPILIGVDDVWSNAIDIFKDLSD